MPARPVTFDRPVPAKLVIRLENGDEIEDPTPEDLRKFDLVNWLTFYGRFENLLRNCLERAGAEIDLTAGVAGHVRYLVECAINDFPDHFDDGLRLRLGQAIGGFRHSDYDPLVLSIDLGDITDMGCDRDGDEDLDVVQLRRAQEVMAVLDQCLAQVDDVVDHRWAPPTVGSE